MDLALIGALLDHERNDMHVMVALMELDVEHSKHFVIISMFFLLDQSTHCRNLIFDAVFGSRVLVKHIGFLCQTLLVLSSWQAQNQLWNI